MSMVMAMYPWSVGARRRGSGRRNDRNPNSSRHTIDQDATSRIWINMNLDELTDFLLVAKHGGFAQASRLSGRPKASLSRRVMELESALGVRLLERTARAVRLTEEGQMLLARTGGPLREIAEAAEALREGRTEAHGLLRVNTPVLTGQLVMGRVAAEFTQAYPQVQLAITLEDRPVDLVSEGYDVVIRVNPEPDSALVGRCFRKDPVLVVSTPELKRRYARAGQEGSGTALTVPVIARSGIRPLAQWRLGGAGAREFAVQTVLELPTLLMMRDAALTGLGIARLPQLAVCEDLASGRLVSWGPASDRPAELWVLHASRRLASAKVKAFVDFLSTRAQVQGHPLYQVEGGMSACRDSDMPRV
ncbi:LysR family transcriptional regulator [Roseateles sp. BYS180W]|uniref:LysR family transcriptional regulator n=1 Tax=Roseateles rivi TaxID=3299028 RepID=A0ABW7FR93_9BURK